MTATSHKQTVCHLEPHEVVALTREVLEEVRRVRRQADRVVRQLQAETTRSDDAEDGWRLAA